MPWILSGVNSLANYKVNAERYGTIKFVTSKKYLNTFACTTAVCTVSPHNYVTIGLLQILGSWLNIKNTLMK